MYIQYFQKQIIYIYNFKRVETGTARKKKEEKNKKD